MNVRTGVYTGGHTACSQGMHASLLIHASARTLSVFGEVELAGHGGIGEEEACIGVCLNIERVGRAWVGAWFTTSKHPSLHQLKPESVPRRRTSGMQLPRRPKDRFCKN